MICPYCKKEAPWISNEEVYGKRYGKSYMCYYCKDCDAYVGCHENTKRALGTMANQSLRTWRMRAHRHFDVIWKSGKMSRKEAYKWLGDKFKKEIHIGSSDIPTCQRIVSLLTPTSEEEFKSKDNK